MNEREWLTSQEPLVMLGVLEEPTAVHGYRVDRNNYPTERKLRLWVEACRSLHESRAQEPPPYYTTLYTMNGMLRELQLWSRPSASTSLVSMKERADLLREIVGNPFQPAVTGPWINDQVISLAWAAYESPRNKGGKVDRVRLLILADALEDSDCDDLNLLDHLRGDLWHVSECWAISFILRKG